MHGGRKRIRVLRDYAFAGLDIEVRRVRLLPTRLSFVLNSCAGVFPIYEESLDSCLIPALQNKVWAHRSLFAQTFDRPRCAIRKFASEPARNFDDSHGGHVSRKSSLLKLERVFTRSQNGPKWVRWQSLSVPRYNEVLQKYEKVCYTHTHTHICAHGLLCCASYTFNLPFL